MWVMSSMLAVASRHLPRGWGDLGRQLAIWFGFAAVYQLARGVAERRPPQEAFTNGLRVIHIEMRLDHRLYELTFQQFVDQRHWLDQLVSWTYWNSEFTVVGLTLLWVYLRRHVYFIRFRNSILLANVIGLVGYVAMPTAPPRLLGFGFVNTHRDGLVTLAANPYAAMPSLHAADALIVGVVLWMVVKHWWAKVLWLAWPAWVWFAVMATGNHFWLDCLAGSLVAAVSLFVVFRHDLRHRRTVAQGA
jgi:membrane-associated phospholipid phosphatase